MYCTSIKPLTMLWRMYRLRFFHGAFYKQCSKGCAKDFCNGSLLNAICYSDWHILCCFACVVCFIVLWKHSCKHHLSQRQISGEKINCKPNFELTCFFPQLHCIATKICTSIMHVSKLQYVHREQVGVCALMTESQHLIEESSETVYTWNLRL